MRQGQIQFESDEDRAAHMAECQAAVDAALADELAALTSNAGRADRLRAMQITRGREATDRIRTLTWERMRNAA